jgi:hypothetical protein
MARQPQGLAGQQRMLSRYLVQALNGFRGVYADWVRTQFRQLQAPRDFRDAMNGKFLQEAFEPYG